MPEKVTAIGSYAFYGCTSLKALNIPTGVTTIENYTFYNCKLLNNIELPEGVTYIGRGAFTNCDSLTSINIPSPTTTIYGGFYTCDSLTEVYFSNTSGWTRINSVDGSKNTVSETALSNPKTAATLLKEKGASNSFYIWERS